MRFDMHCHTKEGSLDSKVPIQEYIDTYTRLGYDGFMITDHNSYRGCKAWHVLSRLDTRYNPPEMTILCGIEYDTKDAGHVLVVMPDGVYLPLFQIRGMRVKKLANFVHRHGGIIGLAHPFGIPASSAMSFRNWQNDFLKYIDFVETFNTCEKPLSNDLAYELASKYNLPGFGGTDAHDPQYLGMAYTEIDYDIQSNNDLIEAVRQKATISAGGIERGETTKGKAKDMWLSQLGYRIYNKGLGKLKMPIRKHVHRKLSRGHKPIRFKGQ